MREILFRGWDDKLKSWTYGSVYKNELTGETYIICVYRGYVSVISQVREFYSVSVIPESIGQFTGLTDKNGKKIFEGDIVDWGGRLAVCVFEKGKFLFKNKNNQIFDCYVECAMCQVIGNIFENKELLND